MTPAINAAKKAKIPHTLHPYDHDPAHPSFGEEAAEKLGVSPDRVFKTLVILLEGKNLAAVVVPVSRQADLKAAAKALGAKKAAMAPTDRAERATGYLLGGISPLGMKKRLPMLLDASAAGFDAILVSGGKRGLDVELAPNDLMRLTGATSASIAR